jgi:hypothetical protein
MEECLVFGLWSYQRSRTDTLDIHIVIPRTVRDQVFKLFIT